MAERVAMFNMLAPNMLPAANDGASMRTAVTLVTNSGSEVAPARRRVPAQRRPIGVLRAITSPDFAKNAAAPTTTAAATANSPM